MMRHHEDAMRYRLPDRHHPLAGGTLLGHAWQTPWPALSRNVCFVDDPDEEAKKKAEAEAKAKADAELQDKIKAAVAKETEGLKATNEKLKQEKTALTESAKAFEGLDPEEVKRVMALFANNEEAQLIKEGKFDEVVAKKTERMAKEHAKILEAKDAENARLQTDLKARDDKLNSVILDTQIRAAAAKAEVLPSAVDDALLRGRSVWNLDPDTAEPVKLDQDGTPALSKDGKSRLGIPEWFEDMKESAKHWWPTSEGSGAPGARGGVDANGKLDPSAVEGMSMDQYRTARKADQI